MGGAKYRSRRVATRRGYTLVEQLISLALAGLMVSAIVGGFWGSVWKSEWSGHSLAAQSMALQALERTRAAKWDPYGYPSVDQLLETNFPVTVEPLDLPISGGTISHGTNRVFITTVSTAPLLRMVRVECTWTFPRRGVYTNTLFTYRAPDQ